MDDDDDDDDDDEIDDMRSYFYFALRAGFSAFFS